MKPPGRFAWGFVAGMGAMLAIIIAFNVYAGAL